MSGIMINKIMLRYGILLIAILFIPFVLRCPAITETYLPTSNYKIIKINGFTARINPEVLSHDKECNEALKELKTQLDNICQVMPSRHLVYLKQVQIWIEWRSRVVGAAEFHPSVEWLTANGYNPEKAGSIEISNTNNFVQWSRTDQPWMIMHEMSHAYHSIVLSYKFQDIGLAYKNAVDLKLYEDVPYIKGGKQRAYAMNDSKEYFAELSEAYFGKNDFFPFTNSELAMHDRLGYQLMVKVWGKL
jgi:hypothetical protein